MQLCVKALNTFDVDVIGTRLQDIVVMICQLVDVKLEGRVLGVQDLSWYRRNVFSKLSGTRPVLSFQMCRSWGWAFTFTPLSLATEGW
jgi:hypothetical protein